jgi:hypothetical protein
MTPLVTPYQIAFCRPRKKLCIMLRQIDGTGEALRSIPADANLRSDADVPADVASFLVPGNV